MKEICCDCSEPTGRDEDSLYVLGRHSRNLREGPLCEECYLDRRHSGLWVDEDFPKNKVWLTECD